MDCPNPNAVQAIMGPQSQQGGQGVVGNIHGSHVVWQGPDVARVFVWGEEDVLRAYAFTNGKLVTPPTKSLYHAPPGMPGGMLAISANANTAGTGLVWALVPYAGDANQQRGVQAQLLAFDAQNITNDIFRSSPPDDPDGPECSRAVRQVRAPGGGKWQGLRAHVRRSRKSARSDTVFRREQTAARECPQEFLSGRVWPEAVGATAPLNTGACVFQTGTR